MSTIAKPSSIPIQGNPRDYAINLATTSSAKQNNLNNTLAGGATGIVVPTVRTPYTSMSGKGQDATSNQINNAKVTSQGGENAKYDSYASKGGKRKKSNQLI